MCVVSDSTGAFLYRKLASDWQSVDFTLCLMRLSVAGIAQKVYRCYTVCVYLGFSSDPHWIEYEPFLMRTIVDETT
jgi:hypothetical protein